MKICDKGEILYVEKYERCPRCHEEVTSDSDFCPHCGAVFEGGAIAACDTHSGNQAIAICIICRQLLCDECRVAESGRYFCHEHSGIKVEQDWAVVYQSSDINEAELVRAVLESIGVRVVVRNFTPQGFVWDGGSENPLSRVAINRLAKVFVPIPDYLKARDAVTEWMSAREP